MQPQKHSQSRPVAPALTCWSISSQFSPQALQILVSACSLGGDEPGSDRRVQKLPGEQSGMHSLVLCSNGRVRFCLWWDT